MVLSSGGTTEDTMMAVIFETSICRIAKRFRKSTPYSSEV